jgi:hypothetical protein
VQPHYDCFPQPTPANALGISAYLGAFDPNQLCAGYLGDSGAGSGLSYPPFSFRVPAGTNFVLVVLARNILCFDYYLELFGLPCAPPTLAIAREAPTTVQLNWSTAYPGFMVEQATQVDATFTDLPQSPTLIDGRYALTNITTTNRQFFRLKK